MSVQFYLYKSCMSHFQFSLDKNCMLSNFVQFMYVGLDVSNYVKFICVFIFIFLCGYVSIIDYFV